MNYITLLMLLAAVAQALPGQAIPYSVPSPEKRVAHSEGFSEAEIDWLLERGAEDAEAAKQELWRRRGGGGGRGGGSSGGSSSGGSSSGSSGGSRSGSSSGGSSSSSGGSSSGSTSSGRSFGGGSTYPGGSRTSYTAGSRSPGGIAPFLIGGAAVGLALSSLYLYPYHTHYNYYNSGSRTNSSLPVDCLCQPDDPCGCDDTNNQTSINEMLKNSSIAKIQNVNGTQTVVINGTLLNSTSDAAALFAGPHGWTAMSGTFAIALLAALLPMA